MIKCLEPRRNRQRGTALVISLVMLVALMLLGISGLTNTGLQMRMGTAMYDRQIAFHAAEAALRAAEATLRAVPAPVFDGTAPGYYPTPVPTTAGGYMNRWDDPATVWVNATKLTHGPRDLTPQFIVENMGQYEDWFRCRSEIPYSALCETARYRITGRSAAPGDGASVALQSSFKN